MQPIIPEKSRYLTVGDGTEAFRAAFEHLDLSGLTVYVLGAGTGCELEQLLKMPEDRRPKAVVAYELDTTGMPEWIREQTSPNPGEKWITLHEGPEAGNFASLITSDPKHALAEDSAIICNPPYGLLGFMRKKIINPAEDKVKGVLLISSVGNATEHYSDCDMIARIPANTSFDPPPKQSTDHVMLLKGFEGRIQTENWQDVFPPRMAIRSEDWGNAKPPVTFLPRGGMQVEQVDTATRRRMSRALQEGLFNPNKLNADNGMAGAGRE